MPYNSETGAYERRSTTVIDASPDGDTVYIAIDAKLDQAADDTVTDLNHHKTNGNHYPATSTADDSRFLKQSPAGEVSWANGVVAADAALKDFSNVASGAIAQAKLASGIDPAKIAQDASNRFVTDTEKTNWNAVGSLHLSTGMAALPGTIPANGAELSRTAYAALWAYAQASGNIAASDGAWTKGQYSPGDGSTTFRVMDLRNQFVRGSSGTRAVGSGEEDAFQGHRMAALNGQQFLITGAGTSSLVGGSGWPTAGSTGDPVTDSVNGTPRTASETRPKNAAFLWCIKY